MLYILCGLVCYFIGVIVAGKIIRSDDLLVLIVDAVEALAMGVGIVMTLVLIVSVFLLTLEAG